MKKEAPKYGWMRRIALAGVVPALVCLFVGLSLAAEAERAIPVLRDGDGSTITVGISREGSRQTATPSVFVTARTIETARERLEHKAGEAAVVPASASASKERSSSPNPIETLHNRAEQAKLSRAAVPESTEITARGAIRLFKTLRSSMKGTKAPPAVATSPTPEENVRMAAYLR